MTGPDREEVVIVGMAGRFPGAGDVGALWTNLRDGVESIRRLSVQEMIDAGVDPEVFESEGYVAAGAPLEGADCFDSPFFSIGRREADMMDPQHRVFLECAWAALEDAGHDPATFEGHIGIFGGVAPNTYRTQVLDTRPDLTGSAGRYPLLLASEREYAVTRVAFKLGLTGPAISVNTACSTSGVALHLAYQSVLSGECDLAIVGGARVAVPQTAGYVYEEDGILSPDGHCRAFDAGARGTVIGSGVAMVVIKRLSDAIADRNTIRAVVKSTAINNDGSDKLGYTAPGVAGQKRVVREALDLAEVDASTISYVEAHGTGTFIGDPIEVTALTEAFRVDTDDRGFCRIGSIKTNIGHLDAGAGVAGIIKTVLALENEAIPPTLHFDEPNPQIPFETSPFVVADSLVPWPRQDGAPRRAGVSSFGLGGTNFHTVLEEAPAQPTAPTNHSIHLMTVSGRTESAAEATAARLADHLRHTPVDLADAAHTLAAGRRTFDHRRVMVASDRDGQRVITPAFGSEAADRPVVFMFPGGGAQHVGMARGLMASDRRFRSVVDEVLEIASERVGVDLRKVMFDGPDEELERPTRALPTLFAVEMGLARGLMDAGVHPDLLIGHSLGEYTAACLAGVISLEDATNLVTLRGELFETLPPGAMSSIALSESEVAPHLDEGLSVAVINRPDTVIVAGTEARIEQLEKKLASDDIETRRLRISVAAHSHLVEPILDPFRTFVSGIDLASPTIPIVSNLTGDHGAQVADPEYWVSHLRHTVRFVDGLSTAIGDPAKLMIEVGPGNTLSGLARQHPDRNPGQVVVPMLPHPKDAAPDDVHHLTSIGRLWAAGAPIDLKGRYRGERRRLVPLPTYAFDRVRHWIEPGRRATADGPVIVPERTVVEQAPSATRLDRIRAMVTGALADLSGLTPDELRPEVGFLELGFDSLFMTQAAAAIGRETGVRISFRQLFEDTPTIEALARVLDERMAPGELDFDDETRVDAPTPAVDPESVDAPITGEGSGPWKPPQRGSDWLSDAQRRHIDELTRRLVARSPSSKERTEANRSRLADPRTVAGFRRSWKEMVYPLVVDRSSGSQVWDVDGNSYLDIAMGFGVNLFGHSPPFVLEAVRSQLDRGIEIGPQTPLAYETAALLAEMTGHERVAFANTGSEAVLAAMRLSRTVTGRPKIATFVNDYHGLFDEVLARSIRRGDDRRSIPLAPGIPAHASQDLVLLDYDDPESLRYIEEHADELAAVLVEPVQSRHPDLQPAQFLRSLRELTAATGVALVFDEMITGFRAHPGGVQALFDVRADIATYGKVIGGGFPIGVVAGSSQFMDALDGGTWRFGDDSIPEADVTWFAGTFVRHPVALAASKAALEHMKAQGPSLQESLNERTGAMVTRLNGFMRERELPIHIENFSSMFLTTFQAGQEFSSLFYFHLRDSGIHVTEGRSAFLSTAHTDSDIDRIEEAYRTAATEMAAGGFLPQAPVAPSGLPLTGGQREVWLASQLSPGANAAFNLSNTLDIEGPVDPIVFQRAVDRLIERHGALRTRFAGDRQVIASTQATEVAFVDLSEAEDRSAELDRLRSEDVSTPFDLDGGVLHRFTLVRLAPDRHLAFVTVHHSICDGWSSATLLRELTALYTIESGGDGDLIDAPMQFEEYIRDEQADRATREWDEHLRYWAEVVDQFPVSDLPLDRPRTPSRSFAAERVETVIPPTLSASIREVAKKAGTTPFVVMLASFECLLARLTGQDEVGLAISVAGHTRYPNRGLVGHCVNALPFRRAVDESARFLDHLRSTKSAFLDTFDHQLVSIGDIIAHNAVPRQPGRNPLASVAFNMDSPSVELSWPNGCAVPGSNPRASEFSDVFINIVPFEDRLRIECTFGTELFERETMELRLEEWMVLLEDATRDPGLAVGDLRCTTTAEIELIERWNDTDRSYPAHTLASLFHEQVEKHPDAPAVIDGDLEWDYATLGAHAERVAQVVADRVPPGAVAGVMLRRSAALVAAIQGVFASGAVYLPLDPELPLERIRTLTDDAQPVLLLVDETTAGAATHLGIPMVDVGDCSGAEAPDSTTSRAHPDDPAVLMYTSGSTGRPKGVVSTHSNLVNHTMWFIERFGIGPGRRGCAAISIGFDASLLQLVAPVCAGASIVIIEPGTERDVDHLVQTIRRHQLTDFNAVPSLVRLVAEHPDFESCTSLVQVQTGGESLRQDLVDLVMHRLPGVALSNVYGPTEAAIGATEHPCAPGNTMGFVPIGRPVANARIHILDARLRPVPRGAVGELCIGGAQVAAGYHAAPELTAERFVQEPGTGTPMYRSGDAARWRADGTIEFIGRIDDQVKIRGNRVELGEVEQVLAEHTLVSAAAVAVGDAEGASLVAAVVGDESLVTDELKRFLRTRFPAYMVPSAIEVVDELPLLSNGKLDRRAVAAMVTSTGTDAGRPLEDEIQHEIAAMWSDVVGVSDLWADSDFFDIGGNSLHLIRVHTRFVERFGVAVRIGDLFADPTVAGMSDTVMAAIVEAEYGGDLDELLGDLDDAPPT